MTTSDAATASLVNSLGLSLARLMPTSSMTARTAGLMVAAGADPAESTCTRAPAYRDISAAAIWDRPALCTHTNSTVGTSFMRHHQLCGDGLGTRVQQR